jgi:Uma2 family endonuclease
MNSLMESWPGKHRITVDEYHRMGETGLLAPDVRVELIEGEIIDMAPIGVDHNGMVNRLSRLFHARLGGHALVQTQGVVRLDSASEPQPDVALLRLRADDHRRAHPAPADILLVVEVSDATLHHDCNVKVPLYARHEVPEAWIVDLRDGELRWYRQARAGGYLEQGVTKEPGVMLIAALPGVGIDLSGLFSG